MDTIIVYFEKIKEMIVGHPQFAQDVLVALFGVVIAAFLTAYINNRAVRKQAKFNMEFEMLKKYSESVKSFCGEIESVEILLATQKWEIKKLAEEIISLDTAMVQFANQVQEERKYVRKYISAEDLRIYMIHMMSFHQIFFYNTVEANSGLPDSKLYEVIDRDKVASLRQVEQDMQKISIRFSDGLEKLMSPGLLPWIQRKIRKPVMIIAEYHAIIQADRYEKKQKRKRG